MKFVINLLQGDEMMVPIRCFTCGSLVGDKFEEFKEKVSAGKDPGEVLDEMGIKRYCCRRMLLSHLDVTEDITSYKQI